MINSFFLNVIFFKYLLIKRKKKIELKDISGGFVYFQLRHTSYVCYWFLVANFCLPAYFLKANVNVTRAKNYLQKIMEYLFPQNMLLLISYGNYNIIINYRAQFETMIYTLIAFIITLYKFHIYFRPPR